MSQDFHTEAAIEIQIEEVDETTNETTIKKYKLTVASTNGVIENLDAVRDKLRDQVGAECMEKIMQNITQVHQERYAKFKESGEEGLPDMMEIEVPSSSDTQEVLHHTIPMIDSGIKLMQTQLQADFDKEAKEYGARFITDLMQVVDSIASQKDENSEVIYTLSKYGLLCALSYYHKQNSKKE